ncbi:MAG: hypothetical protein LBF58_10280 [Deltaproteobacteria bacterium]|jgi:hypothetical protein|nr:hypothetical protein [Deltaproteobacteria bacterium]
MEKIIINSIDELFIYTINNYKIDWNNVSLQSGFAVKIKIDGINWAGKIDSFPDQLLINVQKDFLNVVSSITGDIFMLGIRDFIKTNLRLTANFQQGRFEGLIDYSASILEVLKALSSTEQMILFSGSVAGVFSLFSLLCLTQKDATKTKLIELARNKRIKHQEIATNQLLTKNLTKLINKALNIAYKSTTAPRYLLNQLRGNDMNINSDNEKLNKQAAVNKFPTVCQEDESSQSVFPVWVDDLFEIETWAIKKGYMQLRDEANNSVNANIGFLVPMEMDKFKAILPELTETKTSKIRLRVAIILNSENKIDDSFILQVNPPEEGNPSLSSLLLSG